MSMKNSNDTIWNRTSDLPICSTAPEPLCYRPPPPVGKGKINPITGREGPKGRWRYSSTLYLTSALDWGEWSTSRPCRTLPPAKTRYPLYRRLGGPQGRSGRVRKVSPPTGIRSPDCPTRSKSLYWLTYPDPPLFCGYWKLFPQGKASKVWSWTHI